MMFDISVKARMAEGILERVLGVVRYRGYQLRHMNASPVSNGRFYSISMNVVHPTEQCHLVRHLEKLWDVETVEWSCVEALPRVSARRASL